MSGRPRLGEGWPPLRSLDVVEVTGEGDGPGRRMAVAHFRLGEGPRLEVRSIWSQPIVRGALEDPVEEVRAVLLDVFGSIRREGAGGSVARDGIRCAHLDCHAVLGAWRLASVEEFGDRLTGGFEDEALVGILGTGLAHAFEALAHLCPERLTPRGVALFMSAASEEARRRALAALGTRGAGGHTRSGP